jgi:hypothetical protein
MMMVPLAHREQMEMAMVGQPILVRTDGESSKCRMMICNHRATWQSKGFHWRLKRNRAVMAFPH